MILGRGAELATVEASLTGAASGRGGALVVRGEAGIGKSALLEHATGRASDLGFRVLGTAGVQAEVLIAYAGIHRLLRTAPDLADQAATILDLPDTLPFRAATALLDAVAAAGGPILITVEDLQWLDDASWDALAFAARRLGSERAAMLLTARDGEDVGRRLAGAGLAEVRLEPLNREDSRALLDRVAPGLTPALSTRVLDAAEGNPLGLVELGEAAARSGAGALLPNSLPLSERLERTFSLLVGELPEVTRTLLLVAALDDGDDLDEIVRACRLLESATAGPQDVDPAVATRLVTVDDRFRLRFRHPLLRSALYQSASAARRREVHAALAEALTAEPDRTVWHRAAAASGPDEGLARQLTEIATRARHREAAGIALTAFERAARLSQDPAARGYRLLAAVDMASEQGDTAANSRLLAEIRPHELTPADRAVHEMLREVHHGTHWSGSDRLNRIAGALEALASAGDAEKAIRLLDTIALRTFYSEPDPAVLARVTAAVKQLMAVSDDAQLPGFLALIAPVSHGDEARRRIRDLLTAGGTDPYTTYHLGIGASAVGDCPTSCELSAVAVAGLREQGRLGVLYRALITHVTSCIFLGDARTALALLPEAESLARELGAPNWVLTAWMAAGVAEALSGDVAAAEAHAAAAAGPLLNYGRNALLSGVRHIRGVVALGSGRPAEAFHELRRVFDRADDAYHPSTSFKLVAHLAEAAAGCGATGELRRIIEELSPAAEVSRDPALLNGLGYAEAVLTDTAEGYEKALGDDLARFPFELARRQHAYGAWLRRRRRPAESRPHLRAAATTFDALGATAWADRSRAELRASGESVRRASDTGTELTPQETQIARLAAQGLSNQDIADRLVLSPRTVSTHLSRIYPKLGIRSRAELARVLGIT
ncbi:LuxR family transcriptional regulator [Actinoplanes sp. NPDC051861]|uniref:LuxR family transcriptional regulator n=1 Tax=Actinoplanes sp. NPDC051861 TaxID=3155170 RepID=UPI003447B534